MKTYGVHDVEEFRGRIADLRGASGPPSAPGRFFAYTDGACLGNPEGPGGWAAAVFGPGDSAWQLFGHLSSTSNNRAEALGVLGALEWGPAASELEVHADSELTVQILKGRYKQRANTDIWDLIRSTLRDKHLALTAEWVEGHAGHPLNELADRLSKKGALMLTPRTEWEREFLKSVETQLMQGRKLSPKQQAVLARMRAPKRSTQ